MQGKFLFIRQLIIYSILDPKNTGNVNNGYSTRRLESLPEEEREQEMNAAYAGADERFKQFDESELITMNNVTVSFYYYN
jgi:hypothetical protein